MKKLTLILCLLCAIFTIPNTTQAANTVLVEVTEKIPGAGCVEIKKDLYECKVESGFGSVTNIIGKIIQYFTYIAALAAVLFIVINGILYTMSGIDPGMKDGAKKRIIQTLIGLIILLLSGTILNVIAPWIYTA